MGKNTNGLMIASIIINVLISLLTLAVYEPPVGFVICILGLFNLIGFIAAAASGTKGAYIVFLIGCALFIPIGLIGMFGAKKKLDELKRASVSAQVQDTPQETAGDAQ